MMIDMSSLIHLSSILVLNVTVDLNLDQNCSTSVMFPMLLRESLSNIFPEPKGARTLVTWVPLYIFLNKVERGITY
jgi:hypothetical protein